MHHFIENDKAIGGIESLSGLQVFLFLIDFLEKCYVHSKTEQKTQRFPEWSYNHTFTAMPVITRVIHLLQLIGSRFFKKQITAKCQELSYGKYKYNQTEAPWVICLWGLKCCMYHVDDVYQSTIPEAILLYSGTHWQSVDHHIR